MQHPPLARVLPKWWKIAKIWFTGDERWKACGYAVAVVGLALVNTLFSVHISYAQRDFSTAMSAKDVPGFYAAVRKFVVIIIIAAPLFSFTGWVEDRMMLSWRAFLTRRLTHAYFASRAYYHIQRRGDSTEVLVLPPPTAKLLKGTAASSTSLSGGKTSIGGGTGSAARGAQGKASHPPPGPAPCATSSSPSAPAASGLGGIDNPDQRICDDVAAFIRSSLALTLTLCRKIFNCVAFAGVLWGVSGHLVLFMLVYAAVGTFVTTAMFGRVLSSLYYRTIAREADLRFSFVRVREHAESIAFYRGEPGERSRVLARLSAVLRVVADRVRVAALYDLWTSVYSYATILVPSLLTAPRYFRGEIEFGVISQASFAYSRIDAALSVIINNLATISGLAAETERLDALMGAMADAAAAEDAAAAAAARQLGSTDDRAQPPGGSSGGAGSASEHAASSAAAAAAAAATARLLSSAGGGEVILRRADPAMRGLALQRLHVATPGGAALLAHDLSLSLEQGQSLLVVGPSGCGKSSLLRAVAGLWQTGGGAVLLPGPERRAVFFLPQKPFMPLGDLRTQLTFPSGLAEYGDVLSGGGPNAVAAAAAAIKRKLSRRRAPRRKQRRSDDGGDPSADRDVEHQGGGAAAASATTTGAALGAATELTSRMRGGAAAAREGHSDDSEGDQEEDSPLLRGGGEGEAVGGVEEQGGEGEGGGPAVSLSDEELLALLEEVNLPDLVHRVGGLDVELDWSSVLSVGEQQRVAALRVLAARPTLAFLDEATSALDGPTEGRIYTLIRKHVACYVSVGHRMQLLQHHTHVLECVGGGEWRFSTVAEYAARAGMGPGAGVGGTLGLHHHH